MAWRKIVFSDERITYRNDTKDINIYVVKDDRTENFLVIDSRKKNDREIDKRVGSFRTFDRANKFANQYKNGI